MSRISGPEQDARADLQAAVAALETEWARAAEGPASLVPRCRSRLERIRETYRRAPHLFSPACIAQLKGLAAALERAQVAPRLRRVTPAQVRAELKGTFGHRSFRPGQEEIVGAVLAGRDCLGIMPTGAGKSLTYQLPARLLGGTALVVSPLIALMKDQVDAMARLGVRADFLNSTLTSDQRWERVSRLRAGDVELLYVAPEGLEASAGAALQGVPLSLLVIDEAHCISHWGHDFRPAYRNLAGLKARFGAPVLALTATATVEVARDIASQLGMVDPVEVKGSFLRTNLHLRALPKGGEAGQVVEQVVRLVKARRRQSGIVYALSRKSVEQLAARLVASGVRAAAYHAGLPPEVRAEVQERFQAGEVDVVAATVAFGMGIDKPDIRYVIHRDLPRSIEAYYQEIGRAGRDGKPSDCILFHSWADVLAWDWMSEDAAEEVKTFQALQIRKLFRFAEGPGCRHVRLVAHFGERAGRCGEACDRCEGEGAGEVNRPSRPDRAGRCRR